MTILLRISSASSEANFAGSRRTCTIGQMSSPSTQRCRTPRSNPRKCAAFAWSLGKSTAPFDASRSRALMDAVARNGGSDAENTYPLPPRRWWAIISLSPQQKPPTDPSACPIAAVRISTFVCSRPKCSKQPRPVAPSTPMDILSSTSRRNLYL